jgi:hypothetical protein
MEGAFIPETLEMANNTCDE